jgi:hypothetical protein
MLCRLTATPFAAPFISLPEVSGMPFRNWYDSHFWLVLVVAVALIIAMNVALIAALIP